MELRHRTTLQQPDQEQAYDFFGGTLAISPSGYLAIGSRLSYKDGYTQSGSVCVYTTKPHSDPVLVDRIFQMPSDLTSNYGSEIALSNDGQFLAIAAPLALSEEGFEHTGSVYVYRNNGKDQFLLINVLQPPDPISTQQYGRSLAIASNGMLVISYKDYKNKEVSGFMVYRYLDDTSGWELKHTVTGDQGFGRWLSLSEDGEWLAVSSEDKAVVTVLKYNSNDQTYELNTSLGFPTAESDIAPGPVRINAAGNRIILFSNDLHRSSVDAVRIGTVYDRNLGYCYDDSMIEGRDIYREQWVRCHVLLIDASDIHFDSPVCFTVNDAMTSVLMTTYNEQDSDNNIKSVYRFILKDTFFIKATVWSFESFQSHFLLFGRSIAITPDGSTVYIGNPCGYGDEATSFYGGVEIFDLVD